MPLFGRQVHLQIGTAGSSGKDFAGFRVSFDVKMSKSSTPNTATLEAYNLNPASVALAQAKGSIVRLLVGYDVPRLIFQGNPIKYGVTLERKGVDSILRLECQDGGREYQSARVSISFSTSTTLRQAFDAVAEQMGLPVGTIRLDSDFVFPQGVCLAGPAREVLTQLAASTGSQWFIRDGAVQFIGLGEDTGEQAVVFSSKTGNLIGSPTAKDGAIEITGLLAPGLRPGRTFKVESRDYNGFYVAEDVNFRGDSGWDQSFYVVATGKPKS